MHSFDGIPRFDLSLVSRQPVLSRQAVLSALGVGELDGSRLLLYSFGGHRFPIEQCFAKWNVPADWRVLWVEHTDTPLTTRAFRRGVSRPLTAVLQTATASL